MTSRILFYYLHLQLRVVVNLVNNVIDHFLCGRLVTKQLWAHWCMHYIILSPSSKNNKIEGKEKTKFYVTSGMNLFRRPRERSDCKNAVFLPRKQPGTNPEWRQVTFVVGEVESRFLCKFLGLSLLIIIPTMLHTQISLLREHVLLYLRFCGRSLGYYWRKRSSVFTCSLRLTVTLQASLIHVWCFGTRCRDLKSVWKTDYLPASVGAGRKPVNKVLLSWYSIHCDTAEAIR